MYQFGSCKAEVMFHTTYNKEEKLWTGLRIPRLYDPKSSVAEIILRAMDRNKSKIAQISANNGIRMTYDELRIKTVRASQRLRSLGCKPGEVFGLLAKNNHHVAPIVFAAFALGCPINTLDPSFGSSQLETLLKVTKPRFMFCDTNTYDMLRTCVNKQGINASVFTFGNRIKDSLRVEDLFAETGEENNFEPETVDGENDIAAIVFSSGTTGTSKGVCLSHIALLDSAFGLTVNGIDDVVLTFSTLFWVTGILVLLRATLEGSTRIITTEPFSADLHLQLIEKYRVTFALNSAYHINLVAKSKLLGRTDLSSLKTQIIAGSKVLNSIAEKMNNHLPNGEAACGYGLSELCAFVSLDCIYSGCGSVGFLSNGAQVKIIDEQHNRCGVNVDGEICVKFNFKFLGYFGNREASEDIIDDEGFLLTGDIGRFDEDGHLYIVDRKKDMIKCFQSVVAYADIESFLVESPHIHSACIIGIPFGPGTDLPAAVIVRSLGSKIDQSEIHNMVAERFADYCKLRGGVYFMDSLPTTPSGKVIRRILREYATKIFKETRKPLSDMNLVKYAENMNP